MTDVNGNTEPEYQQDANEYVAAAEKFYQRDQYADCMAAAAIAQVLATLALVEAVSKLADREASS